MKVLNPYDEIMETEQKLIKLLFDKPNSKDILLLTAKLEINSNFILSKDIEKLQGYGS